jgi:hypothetical protein
MTIDYITQRLGVRHSQTAFVLIYPIRSNFVHFS